MRFFENPNESLSLNKNRFLKDLDDFLIRKITMKTRLAIPSKSIIKLLKTIWYLIIISV